MHEEVSAAVAEVDVSLEEIFQKEHYSKLLKCLAQFARYSLNNVVLLYKHAPDATMLGTEKRWLSLGRTLKEDSKEVRIIVPVPDKEHSKIPEYHMVSMYDIAQTEGEPVKNHKRDASEHFFEAIRKVSPVPIRTVDALSEEMGDGYYDDKHKVIICRDGLEKQDLHRAAVCAVVDALIDQESRTESTTAQTVAAVSAAYVICKYFHIPVEENTLLAPVSWAKSKDKETLKGMLQSIHGKAQKVISGVNRQLEQVYAQEEKNRLQAEKTQRHENEGKGEPAPGKIAEEKQTKETAASPDKPVGKEKRSPETGLPPKQERLPEPAPVIRGTGEIASDNGLTSGNKAVDFKLHQYSRDDIERMVLARVNARLDVSSLDAKIDAVRVYGSRTRAGVYHRDSPLEVVIHYQGDCPENEMMFQMQNCGGLDGMTLEVVPIRDEESGTLKEFQKRAEADLDIKQRGMQPMVTITYTEHPWLTASDVSIPLSVADRVVARLDADVRGERENPEVGKNYRIEFTLSYMMDGKHQEYHGRQELGRGDGSMLTHIQRHANRLLADEPYQKKLAEQGAEVREAANSQCRMILDRVVPMLTMHNRLSALEADAERRNSSLIPGGKAETDQLKQYRAAVRNHVNDSRVKLNTREEPSLPDAPKLEPIAKKKSILERLKFGQERQENRTVRTKSRDRAQTIG